MQPQRVYVHTALVLTVRIAILYEGEKKWSIFNVVRFFGSQNANGWLEALTSVAYTGFQKHAFGYTLDLCL
jgi:hypothetical protein